MNSLIKQKFSDMVADEIVKFIRENSLKPGDKLPSEKAISEKLNIGRTSVREGLMKLESIGLLLRKQGYGILINEVTIDSYFNFMKHTPLTEFIKMEKKDAVNLLDFRFALETDACLKASQNMSDADIEDLKDLYNKMSKEKDNPEDFINYDLHFHGSLIKMSSNHIILSFYSVIGDLLSKQFQISFNKNNLESINDDHRNIVEAVISRDRSKIQEALQFHFNHIKEILMDQLK